MDILLLVAFVISYVIVAALVCYSIMQGKAIKTSGIKVYVALIVSGIAIAVLASVFLNMS